jgi:hypothetical protein
MRSLVVGFFSSPFAYHYTHRFFFSSSIRNCVTISWKKKVKNQQRQLFNRIKLFARHLFMMKKNNESMRIFNLIYQKKYIQNQITTRFFFKLINIEKKVSSSSFVFVLAFSYILRWCTKQNMAAFKEFLLLCKKFTS